MHTTQTCSNRQLSVQYNEQSKNAQHIYALRIRWPFLRLKPTSAGVHGHAAELIELTGCMWIPSLMTTIQDGGWAWAVLVAAYFNIFIVAGMANVAGMFQVEFLHAFGESVSRTSWVTSLFSSLLMLSAPLSSLVSNMSSCRCSIMIGGIIMTLGFVGSAFATGLNFLLGSFGIIAGIGLGLVYTPSIVAVGYYFERRRSVATGIALSASGAALLVYPFLFQFLVETLSWRDAFLIFAGISCQVCVTGSVMFPVLKERECACVRNRKEKEIKSQSIVNLNEERKSPYHQLHIFRSMPFVCLCLNLFLSNCASGIIIVHFPALVESKGTMDYGISEILFANGVALIVGRNLLGVMVHDETIDALMVYIGCLSIAGIVSVCFPLFGTGFATYLFYIIVMGMYFGSTHTLLTPLTIKFVGLDKLASAYGIEMVFAGSGYLVSPPVAGWLVDQLHSYEYGIVLAGSTLLLSIIFLLVIPLTEAYRSTKGYHLAPSGIHIPDKELEIDADDV